MSEIERPHIYKPYPELVEPRRPRQPWKVRDANDENLPSNGAVDLVDRWIAVPFEPSARPVCRHELAHVFWSPRKLPRVRFDPQVLAVVEDARINLGLAYRGLPMRHDDEALAFVRMLMARDLKRDDAYAAVMRLVASLGTDVEAELGALLRDAGALGEFALARARRVRARLLRSRERCGGDVAPFRAAHAIARELAAELRAHGLGEPGRKLEHVCARAALAPEREAAGTGSALARGSGAPGQLRIRSVPLSIRQSRRPGPGRARRPAVEGSVVRFVRRWPIDRAVFQRARLRGGRASVLIDGSGSMRLEAAALERLLDVAPAGVRVAVYSGRGRGGELRIVAERGRRAAADQLRPPGRGNVVDVPALEWLIRQPAPRLWVSDGHVTGIGDQSSPEVCGRVDALCAQGGVRRVDALEGAVEWFG